MTTSTETYLDSTELDNGALSPEQAAQLLLLAETGDTGVMPETGGAPTTTPEPTPSVTATNNTPPADTTQNREPEPGTAVVLAKDGVHTIPYEKLQQAREAEQHWKAQAEAAQRQLAELQGQAQARADAGQAPTATDNQVAAAQAAIDAGADPAIFGDFSEEALAKGIQTLVAQRVQVEVSKALEPVRQERQESAHAKHLKTIYDAHSDADSVVESAEFKAWVDSQPSAVRAAIWGVFDPQTGGSAQEIVEVFDAFKKSSGAAPAAAQPDLKAAAKAAIQAAATPIPTSLSDIPGARAEGGTLFDRLDAMSPSELAVALEALTPDQRESFLNRQL